MGENEAKNKPEGENLMTLSLKVALQAFLFTPLFLSW
jgi:hypothetical protein